MMPPRNEESKPSSMHHLLNQPDVAVASLVACWASRTFCAPQMYRFIAIKHIFLVFLIYTMFYLKNTRYSLLSIFRFIPLSDSPRIVKLIYFL